MASISSIRSIGHRNATKLRKGNVRTTEALLNQAATRKGRSAISQRTGLPSAEILKWAHQADMMRVSGIGSEYTDLLSAVGVDTIKVLRRRNAENLMESMSYVNIRRRIVQRLPTLEMVQSWIDDSATTDPLITS